MLSNSFLQTIMAIKDQTDAFLSNPRCVGSYNEIIVKCNGPTAVWQNERTNLFNFPGTHTFSKRKKLSIRIMPLKSSYSLPQWDPNGWLNMILENPMLLSR